MLVRQSAVRYCVAGATSADKADVALCKRVSSRGWALASPVQEAFAHQLGGHVGDCALGGGLCWIMVHPAHAKISNLHHTHPQ